MTIKARVTGLDNVIRGFNKTIKKIEGVTMGGMAKALLICRRDAQIMTPVDTGNLINSCFTVVSGGIQSRKSTVTFGKNPNFKSLHRKEKGKKRRTVSGGFAAGISLKANHEINVEEARQQGRKGLIVGTIGYTAHYALDVHERTHTGTGAERKKINIRKPKAQPKFLEESFKKNSRQMYKAIESSSRFR